MTEIFPNDRKEIEFILQMTEMLVGNENKSEQLLKITQQFAQEGVKFAQRHIAESFIEYLNLNQTLLKKSESLISLQKSNESQAEWMSNFLVNTFNMNKAESLFFLGKIYEKLNKDKTNFDHMDFYYLAAGLKNSCACFELAF